MSDSKVEVLPVPEGSIVWLHNVDFPDDLFDHAREAIATVAGHDRFVILSTSGEGEVEVFGPDELVARVHAALATAPGAQAPAPVVGVVTPEQPISQDALTMDNVEQSADPS